MNDEREQIVELLLRAKSQERTVIEFQQRGGKLYALDIPDHVDELEEIVNG